MEILFSTEEIKKLVLEHWLIEILGAAIVVIVGLIWRLGLGFLNHDLARVPVHGTWNTRIQRSNVWEEEHEAATLHQFVNRVWGKTTILKGKRKDYQLRGEIRGQIMVLTYNLKGDSGFDCGAIALEVNPEGDKMYGYEVGYDKNAREISPRQYEWSRA